MKPVIGIIILIVFLAVGFQLFNLFQQNRNLKSSLTDLNKEIGGVSKENGVLKADLEYFANQDNLIKELKGKLNFKAPGEKVIIIVPQR